MAVGIYLHVGQDISHQPEPALRIRIVHLAVDIVFVNPFRQEFADDEIDFTVIGVVSETTGICHHTGIDAFRPFKGDIAEIPHAANKTENEFGSRGYLRMGDRDLTKLLRVKMVVDHDLTRGGSGNRISHIVYALQRVEVKATDDVCLGNQFVGKIFVAVIEQDVLTAGHPFQEIRENIGNNHIHSLTL